MFKTSNRLKMIRSAASAMAGKKIKANAKALADLAKKLPHVDFKKAIQRRTLKEFYGKYGSSKYMPHQGPKECARRRRQMRTGEFAPK